MEENRFEKAWEEQYELLQKHGWIIHNVAGTGHHTHGLRENFDHPDLEVALNIPRDTAHSVLAAAVENIKKGKRYEDGQKCGQVIDNVEVLFKKSKRREREMLRIILPDPQGLFPGDPGCQEDYAAQLYQEKQPPQV